MPTNPSEVVRSAICSAMPRASSATVRTSCHSSRSRSKVITLCMRTKEWVGSASGLTGFLNENATLAGAHAHYTPPHGGRTWRAKPARDDSVVIQSSLKKHPAHNTESILFKRGCRTDTNALRMASMGTLCLTPVDTQRHKTNGTGVLSRRSCVRRTPKFGQVAKVEFCP